MPAVAIILSLMIITVLVVTVVCIKCCRVPCYKCCMKRGYLPPSAVYDSTEKYVKEERYLRRCCSKKNKDTGAELRSHVEHPPNTAGGCLPPGRSRNIKNIFFCFKEAEDDLQAKEKFTELRRKGTFNSP